MLTIEQCRGARGLLGWTQQDLADSCGLSKTAINNFEKGHSDIKAESLNAIFMAFESADIEFLGQDGLRKKTEDAQILRGAMALDHIFSDIATAIEHSNDDILIYGLHQALVEKISPHKKQTHTALLKAHGNKQRILCAEGTAQLLSPIDTCRWLPSETLNQTPTIFFYGEKLALSLWGDTIFVIIKSTQAYEAERNRFEYLWSKALIPPLPRHQQTEEKKKTL